MSVSKKLFLLFHVRIAKSLLWFYHQIILFLTSSVLVVLSVHRLKLSKQDQKKNSLGLVGK